MEKLASLKARLITSMREYMADGDVAYDESHIRECADILERYSDAIATVQEREAALVNVRQTVLALNDLNLRAGEDLIETDQREDICAFVIHAGARRGFFKPDEDVTEEWREW